MPIPVIIVAVGAAVGGAAISEAVGGVFSKLTDKGFPTSVTITNNTSNEIQLEDRAIPTPGNVIGQTGGGTPSQWLSMPAETIPPGASAVLGCYGSGLDGVAGTVRYRLGAAGTVTFAWFAGGGVGPRYAILSNSATPLGDLWRVGQTLQTRPDNGPFPKPALSSQWKHGRNTVDQAGLRIVGDVNDDIEGIDVRFTISETAPSSPSARPSGATSAAATAEPTLTSTGVTGRNAAEVVAGPAGGTPVAVIRQTAPQAWTEFDARGESARFSFVERARDDWSVYLHDQSRDVHLQLDLHRKMVVYRVGDGAPSDLYPIATARGTTA